MMDSRASMLTLFIASLVVALTGAAPMLADDSGKTAFLAQECNKCHSVERHEIAATIKVEKMRGPDMSDVGTRHDAAEIKKIVLREIEIDGRNHKGKWEGKDKDLELIANWLAALR